MDFGALQVDLSLVAVGDETAGRLGPRPHIGVEAARVEGELSAVEMQR